MSDSLHLPLERRLDEIDRHACVTLLETQSVGRLAVADHGYYPPHIVPVNFAMDGERVVFRSDDGLKFKLFVLAEHAVSFEVDSIDDVGQLAWSVVVQGRATLLTDEEVAALPHGSWLRPWAPGDRRTWVRIDPYAITGRRLHLVPRSAAP